MGRWLDRLKKTENPRNKHRQNRQKPENNPFVSFGSAYFKENQKKTGGNLPDVWDVSVETGEAMQAQSSKSCIDLREKRALKILSDLIHQYRDNLISGGYSPEQARVSQFDWYRACDLQGIPVSVTNKLQREGKIVSVNGYLQNPLQSQIPLP